MTISKQDNSKGPRPGKPGTSTTRFGPGYPGGVDKSAAQDPPVPTWADQGTSGGDTVAHPWYGENAQQPGN